MKKLIIIIIVIIVLAIAGYFIFSGSDNKETSNLKDDIVEIGQIDSPSEVPISDLPESPDELPLLNDLPLSPPGDLP